MINIKGQKLTRCMPSKCKPKPFHHNQGSSTPSLKHPKWTKRKQVAQLCLTPHLVCNIMVKLKVCLFIPCFYVFFLIQKFHVAFNELCLCIYIKKKQKQIKTKKKISRFPNLSKKREKFSNEKSLWTRGIEPLSH